MNKFESASILAGMSPNEEPQVSEPTNLHVITGEVVSRSEDGTVMVSMDGLVFSEDDTQYIEMDTIGGLEEGDDATIILAGENGSAMSPLAVGSPGSVDRVRETAENASQIAEAAQAVAEATNQHFWHDDSGAYVTMATQEEWEQSHSGHNSLWNALGTLFRDGLNNLLTLTTETGARALTIWDGLGNAASNVLASFSENGVDIRQNGESIANFGERNTNDEPTVRIGPTNDYHMSIDQDSLDMHSGDHKIAAYSASVSSVDDGGVHDITVSETSIHVEPNPDYVAPSQDDPYAGTYDQPPSAGSLVVRGETRIAETASADDEYESYIGILAHSRCVNSDSGNVISAGVSVSTSGVMDSTGARSTIDSKVSLSGNKLQLSREGKTGSGTSVTLDMYQVMQMLTTASDNLTRGSAVSSWSSGTIRKSGKVVTMTINGAKLASALSSGSTSGSIATIPTGYRPTDNLQRGAACISVTGNYANVWFVVGTTGNVAIANRSSLQIPTTAEISMQITYIID